MRARFLTVLITLLGLSLCVVLPAPAASAATGSGYWRWWLHYRVNYVRSVKDLRTRAYLRADANLYQYAQIWADWMATHQTLRHGDLPTALPGWHVLGQNIGYGGSVADIERAFEHSWEHYDNLVCHDYTRVGTGVAYANGAYWVVQDFMG